MTRAQALVLLKRYGFDNSDPLNDWLDEGQIMTQDAHDWPFLQIIDSTIASAVGNPTLVLPSSFFKIQSIRNMTHQRKLKNVDISGFERDIDDPTQLGLPSIYTVWGVSNLQLYPVPDAIDSYRVVYQRDVTPVSQLAGDGTNLDLPHNICYPVVLCAAYVGLMAENEEDRAQAALGQFDQAVEQRWQRFSTTDLDEPKQVVDIMGYGDR
jgi:hypothetical protein